MRYWIALALLSLGLLSGQRAWSASPNNKTLARTARKACLSGDYAKGVSILADLYVETSDPNYLFNQARCYEQNLRFVEAAERFKEYLRKAPRLGEAERADVEKHIVDCEAVTAKAAKAEAEAKLVYVPPAAVAPEPVARSVEDKPAPPAVEVKESASVAASAPEQSSWKSTAKWIAAGAAVGLATFGAIENYRYYTKNRDFNNATCYRAPSTSERCQGLASSADTAQILSIVGYSAAGATAVAALVFWLTDSPPSQPSAQAGIGFSCLPSTNGLACQGRF
jgi:hypothetical protein